MKGCRVQMSKNGSPTGTAPKKARRRPRWLGPLPEDPMYRRMRKALIREIAPETVLDWVEAEECVMSQSLGYDRILGQEIQRGGMMLLADFPQMAVAGKHLGAAQYGRRLRNGVVFPKADGGRPKGDGGGTHVTSTFDDGRACVDDAAAPKLRFAFMPAC